MELLNEETLEKILNLEDLSELISVSIPFENLAKEILKHRNEPSLVLKTEEKPLQEPLPPKKVIFSDAKESPSLPSLKKKEAVQPSLPKAPETVELPPFSETTIAQSERGYSHLHFAKKLPDDTSARIIKQGYLWKYPEAKVLILSFSGEEEEKKMWKRLADALCHQKCKTVHIDALILDHPAKWKCLFQNSFSWVLAPPKMVLRIPYLAPSYTYSPHTHEHHLFGIHLFPLKAGHQYLEHPDLKKELWMQLCHSLALPKSP